MQKRYIMTAFGKDRPGIVADVTELLYENGCNLEDTSMTMLADEFTINLLFSSTNDRVEADLRLACAALEESKNITAFIRPVTETRPPKRTKLPLCTIHVEGLDQAGIVFKISRHLAEQRLNIVDLKSSVKLTPESGTALYLMDIHIEVPGTTSIDAIEKALNGVAEEINVEISVSP